MPWSLTPGHQLALRPLGEDECLLHHAASNDTLRVPALVGELLTELARCGAAEAADLADALELDEADVRRILDDLAQRHWVVANEPANEPVKTPPP